MSDLKAVVDECQAKIRPTSTYVSRDTYSKQAQHCGVEQDGDLSDLYTEYSEYCVCMKVLF